MALTVIDICTSSQRGWVQPREVAMVFDGTGLSGKSKCESL